MTVPRRRTKRRWLRWLLLLAVLDAAAFYWWWSNQAERRYNSIIRDAAAEFGVAVSYTHLTLPTICSV